LYFYFSKILAPFLNLTNFLFFLLIILIFFNLKKQIRFKKLIIICLFVLTTISLFPLGKLGLKYLEKDYLIQMNYYNIDNIIVLSGSEDLETTKITNKLNLNEGSERLIASVKIAKENSKSHIYHLGGNGYLMKNNINENEVAKLFYQNVGFDLNRVNFINNSRNTIENFSSLKKENFVGKSNILITSAFHMKRAMMISGHMNLKFIPYAVDFRSINHSSFRNYYQSFSVAANWSSFNIFFREIIGILAFKLFN
tara:strand:+ start:333 stop:1094 length:762 start_codon:yes stop_codon:yes gene_type:complete